MRIVFAASTAVTAGLVAAGVLGVAGAETPTSTTVSSPLASPPRTVSVQGVAHEAIDPNANAAQATAVYRQGMADAIADGQAKAQFLVGKAGATLGSVQSIAEGGGYIGCTGESEYLGEQPDFGSSATFGGAVGVSAPSARPVTVHRPAIKRPRHRKRHAATGKKASTGTCTLSTQLSLAYALQ
jgi:Protein of unknown function (DUF541)